MKYLGFWYQICGYISSDPCCTCFLHTHILWMSSEGSLTLSIIATPKFKSLLLSVLSSIITVDIKYFLLNRIFINYLHRMRLSTSKNELYLPSWKFSVKFYQHKRINLPINRLKELLKPHAIHGFDREQSNNIHPANMFSNEMLTSSQGGTSQSRCWSASWIWEDQSFYLTNVWHNP